VSDRIEHTMARPEQRAEETNMVNEMMNRMRALVTNDEGQDLIEYALLAGLISLVAVATVTSAGTQVSSIFQTITSKLTAVNTGS
jgi:pilus assembly protein Flp/PilA